MACAGSQAAEPLALPRVALVAIGAGEYVGGALVDSPHLLRSCHVGGASIPKL